MILSTTGSTNNYAMAKLHAGMVVHEMGFLALEQNAGKGQRGKTWISKPGENITMTTVFQPASYKPFQYSAAVALAVLHFLEQLGVKELSVKWPNDVFAGDRKTAGILIENVYRGGEWTHAVTGTGVNLNQAHFGDTLQHATSASVETGKTFDLVTEGRRFHGVLCRCIRQLEKMSGEEIMRVYNERLYKRGQEVRLRKGPVVFTTTIHSVDDNGKLITDDALQRSFTVGEVEFVR